MSNMELLVGQRIEYSDSCIATVRYVGPVATSKKADTIWIGLSVLFCFVLFYL